MINKAINQIEIQQQAVVLPDFIEIADVNLLQLALDGKQVTGDYLKVSDLSKNIVYTTGNQVISGDKVFLDNLTINNLTVTGTETIVNTNNVNIGSNYLLLNVTGGESMSHGPASDGGIFFVTGEGLTGINDSGAILGYDSPAGKWVFGIGSRNGDLEYLNEIASVAQVNSLSGYVNNSFYAQNNPSGFITGVSDFAYLSGDLSGNLLSPTLTKIQGNPVSSQPPAEGQTLQWNGTAWVPGAIPAGGNGGGGRVYYFNFNNTSGIAPTGGLPTTGDFPISLLGRTYDIGSGSAQSANLDPHDTYKLICGFVSASEDVGITTIPAGLWDFNIWASVDSQNATQSSIKTVLHIYNPSNSTYRKVAESDDVFLYDMETPTQYITNITVPQTGILATERLYIEVYGKKYTSSSRRITLYFDSYRPSHVHTTIPSVLGNGVVKVINGVFQSPATGIFDSDVDNNANIAQGKIANLTTSLANLYPRTNPSGFITGVDLSAYALNANTGSFITTAQTGAFGINGLSASVLNLPTDYDSFALTRTGGNVTSVAYSKDGSVTATATLTWDTTTTPNRVATASDGTKTITINYNTAGQVTGGTLS